MSAGLPDHGRISITLNFNWVFLFTGLARFSCPKVFRDSSDFNGFYSAVGVAAGLVSRKRWVLALLHLIKKRPLVAKTWGTEKTVQTKLHTEKTFLGFYRKQKGSTKGNSGRESDPIIANSMFNARSSFTRINTSFFSPQRRSGTILQCKHDSAMCNYRVFKKFQGPSSPTLTRRRGGNQ